MPYTRVGVVTGANKGIGLAIVRQIALQYPKSPLNNGSLLLYLTSRDKSRGEAALKELQASDQLKEAKALESDGGLTTIKYHVLDITDAKSLEDFTTFLRKEHGDGIDFVVNNAAIAMQGFNPEVVRTTLACNYYATLSASHAFLPLISQRNGRLVNMASRAGALSKYSPTLRARFQASKTEQDVTSLMQDFASAVDAGREKDAGFPSAAYAVSKAGLIGATRALAGKVKEEGSGVLVNSCCPGYVKTDMTRGGGTKTPDEGAMTPVLLAVGDVGGRSGLFWAEEDVVEW